jgi:hypothetical protein
MKKPIKICKNPDCKDEIRDYKSSKKEYCTDYCRNHHGHKRRSIENLEFTLFKNGMKSNYKALKFLEVSGILREDFPKVMKMGFDPNYLPKKNINPKFIPNMPFYIIKDIIFGLDSKTNEIVIIQNKKTDDYK